MSPSLSLSLYVCTSSSSSGSYHVSSFFWSIVIKVTCVYDSSAVLWESKETEVKCHFYSMTHWVTRPQFESVAVLIKENSIQKNVKIGMNLGQITSIHFRVAHILRCGIRCRERGTRSKLSKSPRTKPEARFSSWAPSQSPQIDDTAHPWTSFGWIVNLITTWSIRLQSDQFGTLAFL